MDMFENNRRIALTSATFLGLMIMLAIASISQAQASTYTLTALSVTPDQAAKGSSATGSVTINNLDTRNSVSVTVTLYDGGISVASTSATVDKKSSQTVQLSFTAAADGPHCYAAVANPGAVSVGYCEPGGHVLGGIAMAAFNPTLIALAATTTIGAAGLMVFVNRRRKS